jgi:hypothetical protein
MVSADNMRDNLPMRFFPVLIVFVLVGAGCGIAMRIRLIKYDKSRDALSWIAARRTVVWRSYEALFPKSFLTAYIRVMVWVVVAYGAVVLWQLLSKR